MRRPTLFPAPAILCGRPLSARPAAHPLVEPCGVRIRLPSVRPPPRAWVLWAMVVLLPGCVSQPPAAPVSAPLARPAAGPRIEWTEVPPDLGEALRDSLRFGYLEVPADHGEPGGARIRLAVGILPARTARPAPDPVVFITGGPGVPGVGLFARRFAESHDWDRLRERRDFVIMDPRGHGYSDPRLPRGPSYSGGRLCDEVDPTGPPPRSAAAADSLQQSNTAECRRLLLAKGVRTETLSSVQVAQDLELLRRALGASQLNLIGVSYGSRIAAEAVRQVPTAIRAVWYSAPFPPGLQDGQDRRDSQEEVVGTLIRRCAADVRCQKAYPRLQIEYDSVMARLRRAPAKIAVPGPAGAVVINDGLLLRMFSELLRNRDRAARVPLHIHTLAEQGDEALLGIGSEVMQALDAVSVAAGTGLAFRCNDGGVNRTSSQQEQQRCRAWVGAAYDGTQAEPLRSDIPGLITVGEFDRLVTRGARLLAAGLPRAHLVILPWEGHMWTTACAPHIATVFFEAPERAPDTTCVDSIPPLEFATVPGPSR